MISCQKDRKYKKENVELQHVVQGMSIIAQLDISVQQDTFRGVNMHVYI